MHALRYYKQLMVFSGNLKYLNVPRKLITAISYSDNITSKKLESSLSLRCDSGLDPEIKIKLI